MGLEGIRRAWRVEGLDEWMERVMVERVDGDGECYRALVGVS